VERLARLTPGAMLTLAGLLLYFIDSFLPWQKACVSVGEFSACGSLNEWHGIGVLAALLGMALLVWEAMSLFVARPALGGAHPRFVSIIVAAALVVVTLITTLTHDGFRTFWAWAGLIVSVVAAVGVWMQTREEGVDLASFGAGGASTPAGTSAASARETAPRAPTQPAPAAPAPAAAPVSDRPPAPPGSPASGSEAS
jgi:hypothetical protein